MLLPQVPFVTWTIQRGKTNQAGLRTLISDTMRIRWEIVAEVSRKPETILARQMYYYFMNKRLGYSLSAIAREFDKHHTTVMFGVRAVTERLESKDPGWDKFKRQYKSIDSLIY